MGSLALFLSLLFITASAMAVHPDSRHGELSVNQQIVFSVEGVSVQSAPFSQVARLPMAPPLPPQIRLWEAWAKGYATVKMGELGDVLVTNTSPSSIIIDEHIMLMSPSPAYPFEDLPGIDDETQDGFLSITNNVDPGSTLIFNFGDYVVYGMLPPPPWWCLEDSEFTLAGIPFSFGGEILPYALQDIAEDYGFDTQIDIWDYLRGNPTLVIGKTPLWKEITSTGDEVDITLEITNIGFWEAINRSTSNRGRLSIFRATLTIRTWKPCLSRYSDMLTNPMG